MVVFSPLSFVLHFISLWSQVGCLHYEGIPIYVIKNEAAPASCHSEERGDLHGINRSLTVTTSAQGFI